jgi:hypothetical protein
MQANDRVFLDESARRVFWCVRDLSRWRELFGTGAPAWCWERVEAIALELDDAGRREPPPAAALEGMLTAVEDEISNAVAELAASGDVPIPYSVVPLEPLPAPRALRPALSVLRGGARANG